MIVFFTRKCIVVSTTWFLLSSIACAAESASTPYEPASTLSLSQAIEIALARNPDLQAAGFELKAADARITQAGLRPNPELSVGLENFAGSGAMRGTQSLQTTLSLSQVIEMGNKRPARVSLANADRDLSGVEQQARQLDVLTEVTRRFIDVVSAQAHVQLAQSALEIEQRTLDTITTRVEAARSPEAERSRARIALTRAQIEAQQAQSELRAARCNLAALWGSETARFTEAQADLFALDTVASFEALSARLQRNPDFIRFASEARLRDAELRLVQAQARPNLTFSVGVRHLQDTRDNAVVAGFSIPLPLFDRNQGAIREAQVRRAQTDALQAAAFLRARAVVYNVYQTLSAARIRVESLRNDALPQAQHALDQTQVGYERGRFSYLELATAQQELLQLRSAAIDAAADYHRLLAEIERLTGEPLATSGITP